MEDTENEASPRLGVPTQDCVAGSLTDHPTAVNHVRATT